MFLKWEYMCSFEMMTMMTTKTVVHSLYPRSALTIESATPANLSISGPILNFHKCRLMFLMVTWCLRVVVFEFDI